MIIRIIIVFIVLAIGATIAYQMGWLSREGESVFKNINEELEEVLKMDLSSKKSQIMIHMAVILVHS